MGKLPASSPRPVCFLDLDLADTRCPHPLAPPQKQQPETETTQNRRDDSSDSDQQAGDKHIQRQHQRAEGQQQRVDAQQHGAFFCVSIMARQEKQARVGQEHVGHTETNALNDGAHGADNLVHDLEHPLRQALRIARLFFLPVFLALETTTSVDVARGGADGGGDSLQGRVDDPREGTNFCLAGVLGRIGQ